MNHLTRQAIRGRERRRGVVAVYIAASLTVMLGVAALAIDLGYIYMRQTQMQRAADAAALAGAYPLSFVNGTNADGVAKAEENAKTYAAYNDYTDGVRNTTVTAKYPAEGRTGNTFSVVISRPEPLFFAGALHPKFREVKITASSIAVFSPATVDIPVPPKEYGADLVGTNSPTFNFTIYGPDASPNNGDNISAKYLANGSSNPAYRAPDTTHGAQGGFNFIINTGTMTSDTIKIELYDPDTGNSNSKAEEGPDGADFAGPHAVDEIRDPLDSLNKPKNYKRDTTTVFTLYSDNGTPGILTDDVFIASKTYDGKSPSDDLEWVTPDGFSFKRLAPVNGAPVNYRLNVAATDGSSENGFGVRAGPERGKDQSFDPNNGTTLATRDIMAINFNKDVTANIPLGTIPRAAADGKLTITKFDTDQTQAGLANNSVYYTCDNPNVVPTAAQRAPGAGTNGIPINAFAGSVDTSDGAFSSDTIKLSPDYPGGSWTAHYTAGANDTSTWRIAATGSNPGSISLIR